MAQLKQLTDEEIDILLPKLIHLLKKTNKTKTIYADQICKGFTLRMSQWGLKGAFNEARLRKLINYIRYKGLVPIISGSNGYYITDDTDEIIEMANSLESRAKSIMEAAEGLRYYAKSKKLNLEIKLPSTDLFSMLDDWDKKSYIK